MLARHATVMEQLRREIQSNLRGSEDFKRDNLTNMSYLQNALKGSLYTFDRHLKQRVSQGCQALLLYPAVPVNTRVALRTTTLPTGAGPNRDAPVLVQHGEAIAYSVYTLDRQVHLYSEDAEEFRPERWDDENLPLNRNKTDEQWGYLSFNGGPRVCLGRR